jgi:hypothetical protein
MMLDTDNELLRKRDAFSRHLQAAGMGGVISVGLSHEDGEPALVVFTGHSSTDGIPTSFEGIKVVVRTLPGLAIGYVMESA